MNTYINGKRQIAGNRPPILVFPASEVAALVGNTPVARYATWDAHRREIHRAADEARAGALARRAA